MKTGLISQELQPPVMQPLTTTKNCTFEVWKELQQSMVNSPLLFNTFLAELLKSVLPNVTDDENIMAFVDDIIIYTAHKTVEKIQSHL